MYICILISLWFARVECKCADYLVGKTPPPEILTAGFSGAKSRRVYTGGRVPLPLLPPSGAQKLCLVITHSPL